MSTLEIWLHEQHVGWLESFDEDDMERNRLTFRSEWWQSSARPILGQRFEDWAPRPRLTHGPMGWFEHLLPQGPLRRAIARQASLEEDDATGLLTYLGADLPGAVVLRPAEAGSDPSPVRSNSKPVLPTADDPLRFSLAGQQWKLSLDWDDKLTLPLSSETGSFIAKFPVGGFKSLPRTEFATMTWASRVEISMPRIWLLGEDSFDVPKGMPSDCSEVFVIERFDRKHQGSQRVHIEDFAQILDAPRSAMYQRPAEHIAAVLAQICPVSEVRRFVRQLVFCIVAGNGDAHLKNWSIWYPDQRSPLLTPAYDLVSTVLYPEIAAELALTLGGTRQFEALTIDSFAPLARVALLEFAEVARWVKEDVEAVLDTFDADLNYSATEVERLRTHHKRTPLCRS